MAQKLHKTVARNRKATFTYEILDTFEAGLVLTGSEVKSLRAGKCNLAQAYVRLEHGEAWLVGCNIAQYPQAGPHNNHEPERPRKLLLKERELDRLDRSVREKGLTLVPLELYFSGAWAKLKFGLGRGKKLHDKRQTVKERDAKREMDRARRGR